MNSFQFTIVAILATLFFAQLLIEIKRPKYWLVLPILWLVFVLPNFLLGYSLQHSSSTEKNFYLDILLIILKYGSPIFVMIGIHIIFVIIRKDKRRRAELD